MAGGSLSGRGFTVVGGGVVGLSLARALRRRGGEVVLLEARRAGGGASGAAAGLLPQPRGGRSRLARLIHEAHSGYEPFVREVEGESGMQVEFRRDGSLEIALDPVEEAELRAAGVHCRSSGSDARWLDPPAAREVAPGLSPRLRGGLFFPDAAWVHPQELVRALRESAMRAGVDVREGQPASLERDAGGGWTVRLEGEGRAQGPGGRLEGREVLVAAGAWTGELLAATGQAAVPPIRPIRGQMFEAGCADPPRAPVERNGIYVIPRPGGMVWVGATVEDVGFDERVTEAEVGQLLAAAREFLPGLGEPIRAWAGLRPKLLRRGGPLLGEGDPPVLAGHYRSGIHLGPLTAELLAARLATRDRR